MNAASPRAEQEETLPPAMDYAMHRRTYERFLHVTKWFVIHLVAMLPALYFFIVGGQPLVGLALLAVAIGLLVYGIASTPSVARDLGTAFTGVPDQS